MTNYEARIQLGHFGKLTSDNPSGQIADAEQSLVLMGGMTHMITYGEDQFLKITILERDKPLPASPPAHHQANGPGAPYSTAIAEDTPHWRDAVEE